MTNEVSNRVSNQVSTELQANNNRELIKGAILSAIGFGLVVFDPFTLLNLALAVVSVPFLLIAPTHFATAMRSKLQPSQYQMLGNAMLAVSVVLFILAWLVGLKLLAFSLVTATFGLYSRMSNNKQVDVAQRPKFISSYDKDNSANASRSSSGSSSQSTSSTPRRETIEQDGQTVEFPLVIHRVATHLAQLLSVEDLKLLQRLIDEINKSYSYLPYLEEHHAYLATSVRELIVDVAINSIMRLNTMAKSFAKHGQVDANAKALFAKKHQQHVNQLFHRQLDEIIELNASILDKKMAGFATVGTDVEKKFRDGLMELRILLKWFVAQAPENTVCSYEVISKKLEENTLKQMDEVFYKHDTTDAQREQLLDQLDELLAHFQSQSPLAEHHNQNDVLLLTNEPNLLHQNETQNFIDFNKQYVKQLKEHW